MKTIWKYSLELLPFQTLQVPALSNQSGEYKYIWGQVMHVGQQNDIPALWLLVDTEAPVRNIDISIVGTGQECPDLGEWDYLGTSFCGSFVWHVFARIL